eukprot:2930859-Rhodomonas_salina.2
MLSHSLFLRPLNLSPCHSVAHSLTRSLSRSRSPTRSRAPVCAAGVGDGGGEDAARGDPVAAAQRHRNGRGHRAARRSPPAADARGVKQRGRSRRTVAELSRQGRGRSSERAASRWRVLGSQTGSACS